LDDTHLVRDTIYRATVLLDDQKWDRWLELCEPEFHYAIRTFSPEINREVTYLELDRKELESLCKLLPKHNTDHSPLRRHTVVYTVDMEDGGGTAKAVSSVVVHQNLLDGTNPHVDSGESRLFLVGKYLDVLKLGDGKARFLSREVRLDNRRFDKGSHWPI
jgi:methanesulfonate monooxygenase small subunit